MTERAQPAKSHGTTAVLALLFSLLLAALPTPAAAVAGDARSAASGARETLKAGTIVRGPARSQDEDDRTTGPLPAPLRAERTLGTVHPGAGLQDTQFASIASHGGAAYRARAPPAAG